MKFKNYLIIGILIITLSTTILFSGYTSTINKDAVSPFIGFDDATIMSVILPIVLITLITISIIYVRNRTRSNDE